MSKKTKKPAEPVKPELLVIETATGEVVERLDLTGRSESAIERIERGILMNMDRERFHTRTT